MSSRFQMITRAKKSIKRVCLVVVPMVIGLVAAVAIVNTTALPTAATELNTNLTTATTVATAVAQAPVEVATTEVTVAPGPAVEYSTTELEFVQMLNDYRVSQGLEPLLLSDVVTVACERHSSDMSTYDFVDHYTGYYRTSAGKDRALKGTRSDYFAIGTDPAERMKACGYDYNTAMGENLAAGQKTAAEALESLKASATHNANLLSPDYKVIGVALVYKSGTDYGYYWTTDFGGYADSSAHAVATAVASAD